jgi:universal stress protein family protein
LKIGKYSENENTNHKITTQVILSVVAVYGEILQQAEKEHIKLIVIGSRGKSGSKNYYLVVSVRCSNIRKLSCPCNGILIRSFRFNFIFNQLIIGNYDQNNFLILPPNT